MATLSQMSGFVGTSPWSLRVDVDGDFVAVAGEGDGLQFYRTLDVFSDEERDTDGDGVKDFRESLPPCWTVTHPWLRDSDGDGLEDGEEDANRNALRENGETSPLEQDSDGDGWEDGVEALILGSDPLDAVAPGALTDEDGDGLPAGHDPDDTTPDTDGDRYRDAYEIVYSTPGVTDPEVYPPLGDLNGDGAVSNIDALMISSLFIGITPPTSPVFDPYRFSRGDLNRDGAISNLDALVTQAWFMDLLEYLPL